MTFTGEAGDAFMELRQVPYISVVLLKDTVTLSDSKPRRHLILKILSGLLKNTRSSEGIGSTKWI